MEYLLSSHMLQHFTILQELNISQFGVDEKKVKLVVVELLVVELC